MGYPKYYWFKTIMVQEMILIREYPLRNKQILCTHKFSSSKLIFGHYIHEHVGCTAYVKTETLYTWKNKYAKF